MFAARLLLTAIVALSLVPAAAQAGVKGLAENAGDGAWHDHTAYDAELIAPVPAGTRVTLYLALDTRKPALERHLGRHARPQRDRDWLSHPDVARRFGARAAHVNRVVRWARANGLTARAGVMRNHVRVRGSAERMTRLFRLGQVARFRTPHGYRYRAATRAPSIPRALRGVATYAFGLDHVVVPKRGAQTQTPVATPLGADPAPAPTPTPSRPLPQPAPATPSGVAPTAPTQVWGIYTNQAIIVRWDGPTAGTFTATATPGGASCTAPATAVSCTIDGLDNGTAYTVAVTVSAGGRTATSAPSAPVTPAAPFPANCARGAAVSTTPTFTQVANAYGMGGLGQEPDAVPQTIAVIQFDELPDEGDVLAARDACNPSPARATITFSTLIIPGAQNAYGLEANLDLQVIAALAPANTSIVTINAPGTPGGLLEALQTALTLPNLQAVSISYAWNEQYIAGLMTQVAQAQGTTPASMLGTVLDAVNHTALQAGVFAAAGDWGSYGYAGTVPPGCIAATNGASVGFPASVPAVTAVGGTMWPTGTRGSETVWNELPGTGNDIDWPCGKAGTGGGRSVLFTPADWQAQATIPGGVPTTRLLPDLSLLAGYPSYLLAQGGGITAVEGTSAATPLLAAASLRINADMVAVGGTANRLGPLNPYLYALQDVDALWVDLLTGTNDIFGNGQCCTATPGFDLVSGLGAPRSLATWPTRFTQLNAQN